MLVACRAYLFDESNNNPISLNSKAELAFVLKRNIWF